MIDRTRVLNFTLHFDVEGMVLDEYVNKLVETSRILHRNGEEVEVEFIRIERDADRARNQVYDLAFRDAEYIPDEDQLVLDIGRMFHLRCSVGSFDEPYLLMGYAVGVSGSTCVFSFKDYLPDPEGTGRFLFEAYSSIWNVEVGYGRSHAYVVERKNEQEYAPSNNLGWISGAGSLVVLDVESPYRDVDDQLEQVREMESLLNGKIRI
ncbi:MAG: hypothetical protein CSB44_02290 [Gammaproteobacteria bacterium]|nr:MAG: hypothetical protein CSB44_02290 [Gammaproteobacteria bacterium]